MTNVPAIAFALVLNASLRDVWLIQSFVKKMKFVVAMAFASTILVMAVLVLKTNIVIPPVNVVELVPLVLQINSVAPVVLASPILVME